MVNEISGHNFEKKITLPQKRIDYGTKAKEEKIIARFNSGDESAFNEIFAMLDPLVRRVTAIYYHKDLNNLDDHCQEIWEKIRKGLKAFSGRSTLHTWIEKIIRNAFINDKGKSKREREALYKAWLENLLIPNHTLGALDSLKQKELVDLVAEAVNLLPDMQRKTIWYMFALEFTDEETVQELKKLGYKITIGGIKADRFYAKRNLRRVIIDRLKKRGQKLEDYQIKSDLME
jgi:RNA polymerase sigma factor (sigma-70 family)